METGCQKVQLCSATLVAFAPEIIGPLYSFPLLYLLFQVGEGLLLILVFRIHDRIKKPAGKYSFAPVFLTLSNPNHMCLLIIPNELLHSRGGIRLPFNSVTIPNAVNTNDSQKFIGNGRCEKTRLLASAECSI